MDKERKRALGELGQYDELVIQGLPPWFSSILVRLLTSFRMHAYATPPEHLFGMILDRWTVRSLVNHLTDDPGAEIANLRDDMVDWLAIVGEDSEPDSPPHTFPSQPT